MSFCTQCGHLCVSTQWDVRMYLRTPEALIQKVPKPIMCCNCFRPLQYWFHVQCCYGNTSTNCFIYVRNACTPLPYCSSSLSASLVFVVECVVSVWRIQSASVVQVLQCFTMRHQCFTMLHKCFTMLHKCFRVLELHVSPDQALYIYGMKPFMNQPIVGELILVAVLVCSCA